MRDFALSRSLQVRFLAINITLALLAACVLLAAFEWRDYRQSYAMLTSDLQHAAETQSAVLAESLWNFDVERTELILSSLIAHDNEIVAATVLDDAGRVFAKAGGLDDGGLAAESAINFATDGNVENLGLLLLSGTDALIVAAAKERIIWSSAFVGALLVASIVSSLIAHRRTIGIPLDRLHHAISLSKDGGVRQRVHWGTRDEMGVVVSEFNEMQDRAQRHEAELEEKSRQIEATLAKEREMAGLQRQFVSMVSHEYRTPLSIIDMIAQRMCRPSFKVERLGDSSKKIRGSIKRMIDLLESTINFAKVDEGRVGLTLTECDFSALILDICQTYTETQASHQINLDLDILPPRMVGDETLLRQVFSNLLSNAVKYSPDSENVWVSGQTQGNDLMFRVRDEGLGIPTDEVPNLFERFVRGSNVMGIAGTGIGLHLARHFVELHGGVIEVDSILGQGTTFTVRLPIAADGSPACAAA